MKMIVRMRSAYWFAFLLQCCAVFFLASADLTMAQVIEPRAANARKNMVNILKLLLIDDATSAPVSSVSFSGTVIPNSGFFSAVADLNGDGAVEALGSLNDGGGNLSYVSASALGLGDLFAPGRVHRDCRVADLNGDGRPDIVCNTYSAMENYAATGWPCLDAAETYSTNSVAMLYFQKPDGTFAESTEFTSMAIRGFGETILVADFNNDGALDIYIPYYSFCSPNEHSYLLMNDGSGNFTDISDAAGVALRNWPLEYRVEGAQAVDFNNDGWIDFYVGSHFFISNGCTGNPCYPTFTDRRAELGLPLAFDEGIKFLDWNNDGYLDLVIHDPITGPTLYQFNGSTFTAAPVIPATTYGASYGLNIYDVNNDGREDIMLAGGLLHDHALLMLNAPSGYQLSDAVSVNDFGNSESTFLRFGAFGDINNDGKIDVLGTSWANFYTFAYTSSHSPATNSFSIEVVGPNGEKNQQGRVVSIAPENYSGVTYTRVVDSGSGYLLQNQYALLVGVPYNVPHTVTVRYANGPVQFTINPGEHKRVYPNGNVVSY